MSDPNRQHDLREIGHLFLSSIRQKQTGNAPPPRRIPPQQRAHPSVDLSPEELQEVVGGTHCIAEGDSVPATLQISVVMASHLGQRAHERVKQYAAQLCEVEGRVGLIEIDTGEFRVMVLERNPHGAPTAAEDAAVAGPLDSLAMQQALDELAWEVRRWLVVLPLARTPEARALLRDLKHMVVLGGADADGIVAAYRAIKGAADAMKREGIAYPRLSSVILDAAGEAQAAAAHAKLAGACRQFLYWDVDSGGRVDVAPAVAEHLVLNRRASHDKATAAAAPQWSVLSRFLKRGAEVERESHVRVEAPAGTAGAVDESEVPPSLRMPEPPAPNPSPEPGKPVAVGFTPNPSIDEVIELPAGADDPCSILAAVLSGGPQRWTDTAIVPPMCSDAKLSVGRDRSLTLLAVVRRGLAGIRRVAQAYDWMCQNRNLIAMALPQFAIEAHALPRLTLLVDHADITAEQLRPIVGASHISIIAYRKLRWSGRTGLLLEAA